MNPTDFAELCRQASLQLALEDVWALGEGEPVFLQDVMFEILFDASRPAIVVLAEMGEVAPEHRVSVYENLLLLQLMSWDQPSLRFGFNPVRKTPLLCASAQLSPEAGGAWLAGIMTSMAGQICEWRTNLLAGKLEAPADFTQDRNSDATAEMRV